MKIHLAGFVIIAFVLFSCGKEEQQVAPNEFTGNEVSYTLLSGTTDFDFYGTATIKEKKDGTAEIVVQLKNTQGTKQFPVHLHYKSFDQEANLAALLKPVDAATGRSVTDLTRLADETPVTYQDMVNFNGHINVHLDDNPNGMILSYGNIGSNADKPIDARLARCLCTIGQGQ